MYGLTVEDRAIQRRARQFADELIPHEEAAELAGGELPPELTAAHAARARELGLCATNMPAELGGGGCTTLQQVLVQEQVGRVTNALAWAAATPPSWLPAVATPGQLERYVRPAIRGEAEECYAITEENAGSDVAAIEATARRDGDSYLLNGVKWHVTSFNTATFANIESVSCGSLGNCAASGSYITPGNVRLAFVVNEVDGSWGNAQNVPGIAALATSGLSDATSVSCASAGNCAAGGFFRGAHGDGAFLADQVTGAAARPTPAR